MRTWLPILSLAALALGGACKRSQPAAPSLAEATLPPIEVSKDGGRLFTHVGPEGTFVTTDKAEDVPPGSRHLVRVVDPAQGAMQRRDSTNVYVMDLNQLINTGKASAKPMPREAFETGALAQLPPGESSVRSGQHPELPPEGEPAPGAAGAGPPGAGAGIAANLGSPTAPVVIVYGTSWCGACRAARQYLTARKIPFADKDVEKDASAARELAEKAARLGVPSDRVPILDVRGRLLIGFDKARLEALLGQAT